MTDAHFLKICIKGGGEMASGIAVRLHRAGLTRLLMLEIPKPLAVRRLVCFSEAVHDGVCTVEDITGKCIASLAEMQQVWEQSMIAVVVDPDWCSLKEFVPDVVIDATLAKKNLGTTMEDAPLVIGIGPGFSAGEDVHRVIETMRGHHLGRVIDSGPAQANTGIPGEIAGYTVERILRAPAAGILQTDFRIGDSVQQGELLGNVGEAPVIAPLTGILRGLIRNNTPVGKGVKIGDIDPRGEVAYADLVSDKARAIGGAVLEAILGAPVFRK